MVSPVRNDVMVDLETYGTRPNAAILTIGAIKFRRFQKCAPLKEIDPSLIFYRRVDLKSCLEIGLTTDKSTEEWWKKQSEEARKEAFAEEDRHSIRATLVDFVKWLDHDPFIWAHGAPFDPVILEEAFRACGMHAPWSYFNIRDTRTLFEVTDVTKKDLPVASHHALEDCYRQICGVQTALSRIRC